MTLQTAVGTDATQEIVVEPPPAGSEVGLAEIDEKVIAVAEALFAKNKKPKTNTIGIKIFDRFFIVINL